MQEVQEEGRYAIDSPGSPNAPEIPPEDYALRKLKKKKTNDLRMKSIWNSKFFTE